MARDKSYDDPSHLKDIPHERDEDRPDFSQPLPPSKLPKSLQETLDSEEKWWAMVSEGKAGESTDSSVRYAGYAARVRTILLAAHRYVAYTSDIGESFRPVAHPNLVRGAYAVSWAYIGGDVFHEGYKAYLRQKRAMDTQTDKTLPPVALLPRKIAAIDDYRTVAVNRAIFQSLASMGLPAFTIHTIVRYSGRAMKNIKNPVLRTWGPIGLGLSVVPALPYLFDKPVEHAVDKVFYEGFKLIGGPEAVGETPETARGKEALRLAQAEMIKSSTDKEKEL